MITIASDSLSAGFHRFAGRALAVLLATMVAACGGGGSDSAATTPVVAAPPLISTQPAAQSVLTDATATFSVAATGSGLAYQWKRNGSPIAGATAASYTTPAVTYVDNGALYTVVVSNADGSVTSSTAALTLLASADQAIANTFAVAGSYQIVWNLNLSGPETPGTNFASYDFSTTPLSPLTNGPQNATQTPRVNLTTTLPLVLSGPTRILKNGSILVVPSHDQTLRASYVGSSVRVDALADDGVTVAFSQLRSTYTQVALAGDVKTATPADMAHYLNSFFSNPAILNGGVNYPAGAAYVKYFATTLGDRYTVVDCAGTTIDANVTPCVSATTLASALAAGITSASDGVTYTTGDGAFSTVGGVQVWVATAPRPLAATLTSAAQYRFYFAQGGNVYTGALTRDGQPFGGSFYVATPGTGVAGLVFLPFSIRLNQAATLGLKAAMAL